MTEPPPDFDQSGDPEPAAEKRAVEIELDRAPELVERRLDGGVSTAVEPPALLCRTCSPPK